MRLFVGALKRGEAVISTRAFACFIGALLIVLLASSAQACPQLGMTPAHDEQVLILENESLLLRLNGPFASYGMALINTTLSTARLDEGVFSFTSRAEDAGFHLIVLLGVSEDGCVSSRLLRMFVDAKPRITSKTPLADRVIMSEGSSRIFSLSWQDEDEVRIDWFLDGNRLPRAASLIFTPSYNEGGNHTITANLTDTNRQTTTVVWKVVVEEVNRPPSLILPLPDVKLYESGKDILNLHDFFIDPDHDQLTFTSRFSLEENAPESVGVQVAISPAGFATISAKPGFLGRKTIVFVVSDGQAKPVEGNEIIVEVSKRPSSCGDGVCSQEDCQSCPEDCGMCTSCLERWVCTAWSACVFGQNQTRECKDLHACGTIAKVPEKERVCQESCTDRKKNQDEEGVDCGGVCLSCPTCTDGMKNGNESDIDCGQGCDPCSAGDACLAPRDCESFHCKGGVCLEASCADGVKNQDEGGVDCGGTCGKACPTCADGIMNQDETAIDCGGICPACPSCADGMKNQGEQGVDCGGPCRPCTLHEVLGISLASLILLFIISLCVLGLLILIEIKYHAAFRILRLDKHMSLLIFFHRLAWSVRDKSPAFRHETQSLLHEVHKSMEHQEPDRGIILIDRYLTETFSLPETFREEKLRYVLRDKGLPYATQELVLLLHRSVLKHKEQKYVTSLHSQKLCEEAVLILKEVEPIL